MIDSKFKEVIQCIRKLSGLHGFLIRPNAEAGYLAESLAILHSFPSEGSSKTIARKIEDEFDIAIADEAHQGYVAKEAILLGDTKKGFVSNGNHILHFKTGVMFAKTCFLYQNEMLISFAKARIHS